VVVAAPVGAQQYVYPAKGQTPEKQKSDESACCTWAVQQTGFDPAKPPPPASKAALHGQVNLGTTRRDRLLPCACCWQQPAAQHYFAEIR